MAPKQKENRLLAIYNSQDLETSVQQMSNSSYYVFARNGILHSIEKDELCLLPQLEWNYGHHVKQNKPEGERQIVGNLTHRP